MVNCVYFGLIQPNSQTSEVVRGRSLEREGSEGTADDLGRLRIGIVLEASQENQENYFKFLSESEARGRELMITAIRELGTVLGSIKNGEKVKAGVEISDEED